MIINESLHDNAALKFVFLAGGPGSGKNYVANDLFGFTDNLSFGSTGMKLVSSDAIFEKALEKMGISKDLTTLPPEEFDKITSQAPGSLRQKCREAMKKQMANYAEQGLGMVYDGLGNVPYSYEDKKHDMEDVGYDTYLLWVETPLETALKRNEMRARKLPVELVKKLHDAVQANKKLYERMFGDNMIVVNNDDGEGVTNEIRNKINRIISAPVKNPLGQHYLHTGERKKRTYTPKHIIKPNTHAQYYYPNPDPSKAFKRDVNQGRLFPAGHGSTSEWSPYEQDDMPFDNDTPFDEPENPFLKRFKQAQANKAKKEKQKAHGGHPMAMVPKAKSHAKNDKGVEKRIYNPDTGNDILVKTALGYPPNHPMRRAAEKYLKK